jgi:hypothetical protein
MACAKVAGIESGSYGGEGKIGERSGVRSACPGLEADDFRIWGPEYILDLQREVAVLGEGEVNIGGGRRLELAMLPGRQVDGAFNAMFRRMDSGSDSKCISSMD